MKPVLTEDILCLLAAQEVYEVPDFFSRGRLLQYAHRVYDRMSEAAVGGGGDDLYLMAAGGIRGVDESCVGTAFGHPIEDFHHIRA